MLFLQISALYSKFNPRKETIFQDALEFEFAKVDSAGAFLGGCGLNQIEMTRGIANLGYGVRSSAMGLGTAVKAVELLTKWGFEIKCAVENVQSLQVAEKAGAEKEEIRTSCIDIQRQKHDAVIFVIRKDTTTEQL